MRVGLARGQQFPPLCAKNIHGEEICIPRPGSWVHLQFRRFAGCPVCNLHLQSFVRRHAELADAGMYEVVVFHSTDAELLPYQGRFPFAVIADPLKELYCRYAVGGSLSSLLNPRAWAAIAKGNLARHKPKTPFFPKGGILGLPADFLIAQNGTIRALHYGEHADDHWSFDQVIDATVVPTA